MTKLTQFDKNLVIIYMLADALELKLTEINPIRNFNDTKSVMIMEIAKNRVKDLRKHFDIGLKQYAEDWGNLSDDIIELIENKLEDKL